MKIKAEREKLVKEIIRAVREVYDASANPFTTISWKKGRKTLIGALKEYEKEGVLLHKRGNG